MMKRIFMLLALALMLVASMALSGVAQAATLKAQCKQQAQSLTGSTLTGYNIVVGNDNNNDFTSKATEGGDVFCGFGGDDSIGILAEGDIFIGGAGKDSVDDNSSTGTFNGGAGNDSVETFNNGTFNGGDGTDSVTYNYGTFNGGAGDDSVTYNYGNLSSVEVVGSP